MSLPTTEEPTTQNEPLNKEIAQLSLDETEQRVRSMAYWFYWIAALSLVNTFLVAKGVFFIVGLAISQIIDGIFVEITGHVNYFISLLVPIIFALFGYFASKLNRWAFIVGAVVYLLDGLIYLYFQSWLAAGFHIFVLYKLYQGYQTVAEYEEEKLKLGEA